MSYLRDRTKVRKDYRQHTAKLSFSARCALIAYALLPFDFATAQEELLRPGEAFVTRFSGVVTTTGPNGQPVATIDPSGTVGAIMDLRTPPNHRRARCGSKSRSASR